MGRIFAIVAVVLGPYAIAKAAPTKVAFDGLFRAKASWRLPCVESHGDGRVTERRPLGDLVCTIDSISSAGTTKRAHLRCAGPSELAERSDLAQPFAPRILVATPEGLWSLDDPGQDDAQVPALTDILRTPPLLASHPKDGTRRRNDGARDTCCGATADSCKPCPPDVSGVEYTTSQLEKSWCVRARPWGTGGSPHATVFCVSPEGVLTGIASFGGDSPRELRCGSTLDPRS